MRFDKNDELFRFRLYTSLICFIITPLSLYTYAKDQTFLTLMLTSIIFLLGTANSWLHFLSFNTLEFLIDKSTVKDPFLIISIITISISTLPHVRSIGANIPEPGSSPHVLTASSILVNTTIIILMNIVAPYQLAKHKIREASQARYQESLKKIKNRFADDISRLLSPSSQKPNEQGADLVMMKEVMSYLVIDKYLEHTTREITKTSGRIPVLSLALGFIAALLQILASLITMGNS